MPRFNYKCEGPGCHKHIKLNEIGVQQLRDSAEEYGTPVGLLCPKCVHLAFSDESEYFHPGDDIPLGEIMVELTKESPRWRIVILEHLRKE